MFENLSQLIFNSQAALKTASKYSFSKLNSVFSVVFALPESQMSACEKLPNKAGSIKKTLIQCVAFTSVVFAQIAYADVRQRTLITPNESIESAWALLECGERYKQVWFGGEEVRGVGKTYHELLDSYDQTPSGSGCDELDGNANALTHSAYLQKALTEFETLINTGGLSGEHLESAKWGLQESFNFLAEGRLLKGNDLMINGLRTRFKAADEPNSKSQIELLNDAVAEMENGLKSTTPFIVGQGSVLRSVGDASPQFPFLVNNTAGPITPNDYQRYAELLNRYGMAAASEAKYIFYKDNVKDVDNPPYRNFPGPEDLDFNNDRIQNQAGRIDAAARAKKAGSHLYLQSLTLASVQNEDHFQDNNGYQIKRQVNDIDRLYQDIQSGFNPLLLAGDFVPYQKVENFLQLARARIQDAKEAEALARANQRTFEVDQTTLAGELRSQTAQYVDQLVELTGVAPSEFDITTKDGRQNYKAEVLRSTIQDQTGLIGTEVIGYQQSLLQTNQVRTQITNAAQKIIIEEERSGSLGKLILENGKQISLLQYANTMASCCNVSKGTSTGTSKGTSNGWSRGISEGVSTTIDIGAITGPAGGAIFSESMGVSLNLSQGESGGSSKGESWGTSEGSSSNPNIETLAQGQSEMSFLQAVQQADVDAINSSALLKNMALELATLNISLSEAQKAEERQNSVIEGLYAKVERTLANYAVAQEDYAEAYYNNPAYRMEASRSEQAAEDTFETALELSYYAAKALEYQWSEKFNNPVLRLDGGMPEPLSVSFDPFVRAESVFSAQFAALYSPSLDDYLDGLQAWDVKMRQLRYPERQTAKVRFSLRNDLLGYGEFTPDIAEAKFRSFIEDNRTLGDNDENRDVSFEFTLDIADERLFPAHPNIKIESINLNLVSTASRSVRGDNNMAPALVDLVMLDRAFVRTFFAEYPARDDLLSYTLQQGRTIEQSPFLATVEANVDGYASPAATQNTQLSNHSPAVSTWIFRMKNSRYNNRKLQLQYLSDVEVELEYSFGKPRDFQFSN